MDIFSQKKMLLRIVFALVLLNLTLIGFFGFRMMRPKQRHQPKPVNETELAMVLKNELDLSAKQAEELKNIRTKFFQKEQTVSNTIKSKRDLMNMLMFSNDTNEAQLQSLALAILQHEYQRELLRIEQAKQLRTICSPAQLKKLQSLVREIRDYLKPQNK